MISADAFPEFWDVWELWMEGTLAASGVHAREETWREFYGWCVACKPGGPVASSLVVLILKSVGICMALDAEAVL